MNRNAIPFRIEMEVVGFDPVEKSQAALAIHAIPEPNRVRGLSNRALRRMSMIVILALLAVACTNMFQPSRPLFDWDTTAKTGFACVAPCWYGLAPGSSNKEQVYQVLHALDFVIQSSISETSTRWLDDPTASDIAWSCSIPPVENCGGAVVSKGTLVELWTVLGRQVTLQDVVNELGRPKIVEYGQYHPVVGGSRVLVVWPDKFTGVKYIDEHDSSVYQDMKNGRKLNKNLKMTSIYFWEGDAFEAHPGTCCPRVPWPGLEGE